MCLADVLIFCLADSLMHCVIDSAALVVIDSLALVLIGGVKFCFILRLALGIVLRVIGCFIDCLALGIVAHLALCLSDCIIDGGTLQRWRQEKMVSGFSFSYFAFGRFRGLCNRPVLSCSVICSLCVWLALSSEHISCDWGSGSLLDLHKTLLYCKHQWMQENPFFAGGLN